jgi:hypothetical protein
LNITIEQRGNTISKPWFDKSGEGWSVTVPEFGPDIAPGETAMVSVNVTPPSDAVAGEIGIISIMIRNGDGAGQVVEQIPVRVGSSPGIELGSKGNWNVRDGILSWPTAWIENTGNDVAIMDLEITNLPEGWTLNGEGVIVVAPGEVIGIPLQVQPASNWDGGNLQFDVKLTHPTLGEIILPLSINQSETVLVSNPVHTGRSGEKISITTNTVIDGNVASLVTLPEERMNVTHNGMALHLVGIPAPIHEADCTMVHGDLEELGRTSLSQTWASCTITANDDHPLTANVWLRSNNGQLLDSSTIRLFAGENTTTNLSISNWDPSPGAITVELIIIDSNGIILIQESSNHISHESGWNVGIDSLDTNAESITIGISRTGFQKLENAVCSVVISRDDGSWSKTIFVDIAGSKYAPIIVIDRPDDMDDSAQLTATISCLEPWDIDDDDSDNSKSIIASKVPLIEYKSADLVWTLGIGASLIIIAWFAGILTVRPKGMKKSTNWDKEVPAPQIADEKEDDEPEVEMEIDDMSLEEDEIDEPVQRTEPEPEPEPVYDIDDDSASGRLSAMKFEIETDADPTSANNNQDISSRLDSFLKDR